MVSAIGGTGLEAVDLTTTAAVKALMGNGLSVSTDIDTQIATAITQVSNEIARYLGFHTLQAARTETYEVRAGKRILTLDGRPLVTLTSLKLADHPNNLATALEVDTDDYVVHNEAGWMKFVRRMYTGNFFAQVEYTGGLELNTAGVAANREEIAFAAGLQAKYYLQRRDSVGGNITSFGGGSTSFNAQYGMLNEVRRILDAYRRGTV